MDLPPFTLVPDVSRLRPLPRHSLPLKAWGSFGSACRQVVPDESVPRWFLPSSVSRLLLLYALIAIPFPACRGARILAAGLVCAHLGGLMGCLVLRAQAELKAAIQAELASEQLREKLLSETVDTGKIARLERIFGEEREEAARRIQRMRASHTSQIEERALEQAQLVAAVEE